MAVQCDSVSHDVIPISTFVSAVNVAREVSSCQNVMPNVMLTLESAMKFQMFFRRKLCPQMIFLWTDAHDLLNISNFIADTETEDESLTMCLGQLSGQDLHQCGLSSPILAQQCGAR